MGMKRPHSMYQDHILSKVRQQRLLHDVTLELTYRCNLDCFYCYNHREKPGETLSLDQYATLLTDLARMQTLFLMLTGGEPMMHPHFFEIGRMAKDRGFVTRVRTNGHSMNERICQRLKTEVDPYVVEVSLHGATAAVHDRQTRLPGSFDRLIQNLLIAREVGLNCSAVCTPTTWNEHQIEALFALCDELEIPLRFQGPVAPRDNGDLEPLSIQPARQTWDKIIELLASRRATEPTENCTRQARSAEISIPREQPSMCGVGVSGVDIDPFGNVQACMHLQEPAGSLHEQSIEEIWNYSPLFQRARAKSIEAAKQFTDKSPEQFGAPLFCIAVEENANKGCTGCGGSCK